MNYGMFVRHQRSTWANSGVYMRGHSVFGITHVCFWSLYTFEGNSQYETGGGQPETWIHESGRIAKLAEIQKTIFYKAFESRKLVWTHTMH